MFDVFIILHNTINSSDTVAKTLIGVRLVAPYYMYTCIAYTNLISPSLSPSSPAVLSFSHPTTSMNASVPTFLSVPSLLLTSLQSSDLDDIYTQCTSICTNQPTIPTIPPPQPSSLDPHRYSSMYTLHTNKPLLFFLFNSTATSQMLGEILEMQKQMLTRIDDVKRSVINPACIVSQHNPSITPVSTSTPSYTVQPAIDLTDTHTNLPTMHTNTTTKHTNTPATHTNPATTHIYQL